METKLNLSLYCPSFWLPLFKNYSLKAILIKLDLKFFKYLCSDGIIIPKKYSLIKPDPHNEEPPIEPNENEENQLDLIFEKIDEEIINAIKKYDGGVFVKLNWKAPKVK